LNRGSRAHVKDEIDTQFDGPVDDFFKEGEIVVRRQGVNLFSESGHPQDEISKALTVLKLRARNP